jgi:small subunit ribosomal protein S20
VRNAKSKSEAEPMLLLAFTAVDKLAKKNIIHKNKAGNLKSSLQKHVNALA